MASQTVTATVAIVRASMSRAWSSTQVMPRSYPRCIPAKNRSESS